MAVIPEQLMQYVFKTPLTEVGISITSFWPKVHCDGVQKQNYKNCVFAQLWT